MGIVHQLPQHVANCIAAGEVVENPSSVAKELCENAVDAGATEITVSMRGGGIAELIVSDNGCGMSREDAELCFARHATSKISTERDLDGITTLGFRGEALAAISAVSRVTLETCEVGAECGTRIIREYGETLACEDAVISPGTTFAVRELFRNTPARMKFLRTDSAEGAAVAAVVGKLALSHPEVAFTMIRDTKRSFETSGSGDLYQAITDFCGREFSRGLLRVDAGAGDASAPHVWGYVTQPGAHRATRGMQYFFLNGRAVQSKLIVAALDDAYHGFIPGGRFPGCVLHVALDPELCDINVHPTKLTVKFTRERDVYLAVRQAVTDVLNLSETRPTFSMTHEGAPIRMAPMEDGRQPEPQSDSVAPEMPPLPEMPPMQQTPMAPETARVREPLPIAETLPEREPLPIPEASQVPNTTPEPSGVPPFRVAGMLFDTYIIVETGNDVVFIDFHATHERLRYNRLLQEYREGGVASQTLLASVILPVPPEEYAAVLEHTQELTRFGVEAEAFGRDEIAIRALPTGTDPESAAELVAELTREWKHAGTASPVEDILHLIACHGAKRAGDSLTAPERESLAARVLGDPTIKSCPHGRPVAVTMSRRDFVRNFGR
ncbi:MAG: DNA mismatch repair endonuclease MutL [Clostridiaceae bacterium]|nr:DNA mismatch repair endonuclease MutL [Clostridiaceae bacterium]